jgi:hypothetical protein
MRPDTAQCSGYGRSVEAKVNGDTVGIHPQQVQVCGLPGDFLVHRHPRELGQGDLKRYLPPRFEFFATVSTKRADRPILDVPRGIGLFALGGVHGESNRRPGPSGLARPPWRPVRSPITPILGLVGVPETEDDPEASGFGNVQACPGRVVLEPPAERVTGPPFPGPGAICPRQETSEAPPHQIRMSIHFARGNPTERTREGG